MPASLPSCPAALAIACDSSKISPSACKPALRGECQVRNRELRIGMVGVGGIGLDQHLPGWAKVPFAEVVAVADLSEAALAKAGECFKIRQRFRDWHELAALR